MSETLKQSSGPAGAAGRDRVQTNGAGAGSAVRGGASVTPGGATEPAAQGGDFALALQEFLGTLLERQCKMVGAVAGVIYLAGSGARQASIGATFTLPESAGSAGAGGRQGVRVALDQPMLARLARYGAESSAPPRGQGKTDLINLESGDARGGVYQPDPTHRVLACPLVAADQVHGASVLVTPAAVRMDPTDALERVALTGAAYEAFLWRNHCVTEAQTKTRLRETLELLDAAQQAENAEAMGAIFCHELQRRFGCTRVSIGMIRGQRLRVEGVSGADDVNQHAGVVESLEAAMEECAEQDIEIVCPAPVEDESDPARRRVTRAHAAHSTKFGPVALLSLPLRVAGDLVGVVTLEREPHDPFPAGAVPLLRLVAEFTGPALWTRRMADRGILAVTRDRLVEIAAATVGPRHTGVKSVLLLVVMVFLAMALVPIPGRVTAEAETRATLARTVPPPFEGFLETVKVKPGDRVAAGDVLATMDLKETQLGLAKSQNTLQKLRTQQDDARNKGQQGDAAVIAAAIEETQFDIKMQEDRIARGTMKAPIAGAVSRGDIEALAGAKVEPATPLFEIIATDQQIVVLQVRERDIGDVKVGQEGRLAPTALPAERIPIRVVRIRPAAETVQKQNVYYVEAQIVGATANSAPDWLKPGMTGTARLENGHTTVLWELIRPVVDAARQRLWW